MAIKCQYHVSVGFLGHISNKYYDVCLSVRKFVLEILVVQKTRDPTN